MPKRHNLRGSDGKFKPEKDAEQVRTEKFLALALERFKLAEAAEARYRREALEDFQFYAGDQWPSDLKAQRDRQRRPCLTINRLKPAKRIITNEYRQQRPAIQVNPVGDGADVDTAMTMQGIVRHVEVNSDAEIAYDTVFDHTVIGGRGWLELSTRYQKNRKKRADGSRPQEIIIRGARNAFMHYGDPASEEPDYSDAGWHFKIHDFTTQEFRAKWPKAKAASLEDFASVGDNAKEWLKKDSVRVAEYWYLAPVEEEDEAAEAELEQSEDAQANAGEYPTNTTNEASETGDDSGVEESAATDEQEMVCHKCLITAVDILEDKVTVFDSIPNVPMLGEDLDINGERYIAGMVRDAKDPQRQFNYWESACTEAIALAPKSPYKAYAKVIEGHEAVWQAANLGAAEAVLVGNAVVENGALLPLPERETPNVDISGLAAMRQSAAANVEAVTGLNDATLGRMKPDESGKAVLARQKQGDISNLNYSDNAARALRRVGRLILPAIPKVYDVPTIMRIVNPDGTHDHVISFMGDEQKQEAQQMMQENPGIKKIFDLSVGSYDVTISVGPSYQTKRQEAVASIMALIQAAPNVISVVGDLLVGNMDWNNAPEIAKRLKKMLPPQLQDDDGQGDAQNQVQQLQAQLAALTQVHQQVMTAFQQAQQIIQTKQVEQAGKFSIEKMRKDADIAMAMFDRVTKLEVANITAKTQDAQARAAADADMVKEMHQSAHELGIETVKHANAKELAQQQGEQAQFLAAQNGAQTADQAQSSAEPNPAQ